MSELGNTDYALSIPISIFQAGKTRACRTISILNDITAEGTGSLTVILTGNIDVVVNNTAGTATLVMLDDNGRQNNLAHKGI